MPGWLTWLTPARRKGIYGALAALGGALLVWGVVSDSQVQQWLAVADAGLTLLALAMASTAARRADWTRIYAAAAVLLGALVAAGVLSGDMGDKMTRTLAIAAAVLPLWRAYERTDTTVTSGAPTTEAAIPSAGEDLTIVPPVPLPPQPPVTIDDTEAEVRQVLHRGD